MIICTIGFSKKNLKQFITALKKADVGKVIDVRLNNTSQLAGYAKKQDLEYVLSLVGIAYEHHPELAPTEEIMKGYKQKKITWAQFEDEFKKVLESREPLNSIDFNKEAGPVCLLCAEDRPGQCHRTLVAEYYSEKVPGVEIRHL